jgi:dTMP kinase
LLDVPAGVAKARQSDTDRPFDRLEAEAEDFHQRVRDGYLALATAEPERFLIIDGTGSVEDIHQAITHRVSDLVG